MNRTRITMVLMAAALLLGLVSGAASQSKTVMGDMTVVKGTVEAVDQGSRTLTVKDSKGKFVTVDVPQGAERFSEVKVGDAIAVRYYDSVTVRLKQPGEPDVDTAAAAKTPVPGEKPAGTLSTQRTLTATIEAIDPKVPSITFVGPNGWKYSRRVADKSVLGKIKVGDRVDFTWTTAVIVDVQPPK